MEATLCFLPSLLLVVVLAVQVLTGLLVVLVAALVLKMLALLLVAQERLGKATTGEMQLLLKRQQGAAVVLGPVQITPVVSMVATVALALHHQLREHL
jgi:hypothetical protein